MANFEQCKETRKWSVRFWFTEFGKRKQKRLSGFSTKKEADKAYADYISKHQDMKASDNSKMIFVDLYNKYLPYITTRVKVSTLYDMENTFNRHILPYFENMKIFKITKSDVLLWQQKLNNQNFSYKFKSKLRGYLSSILKFAVMYYDLPLNPVSQVEPFKRIKAKQEMPIWSKEDFSRFIRVVDDITYKAFFSFLYLTGCRKGEAFALTWNDIDFKTNYVNIGKNLTRKVKDKPYVITSTKTGECRTILLPTSLADLLKQLECSKLEDFVFGGCHPLAENTVTRKFNHYIKLAQVPPIHIHCLRHSHASLLISEGQSIVMVAKRLGHSSIEQTLNTYSHLMPNEENKLIDKLNIAL